MLALDLFIFHPKARSVGFKEALLWSGIWVSLALIFCVGMYLFQGSEPALNFLTGYIIEKALSIDNLFVFLMIFSAFQVPSDYLHKVLLWGVLGALVMRAIFIFTGIVLIEKFYWITYLFGIFLIVAGIKLALKNENEIRPENNIAIRMLRKVFPITKTFEGGQFFVKKEGRYWATPLFLVLIAIETTDIIFALDSVPAILAITTDPFIVYTSNVFAILGLRALYFALAPLIQMFRYLHYGLALLLVFIGSKMLLGNYIHIPVVAALGIVAAILVISIIASVIFHRPKHPCGK